MSTTGTNQRVRRASFAVRAAVLSVLLAWPAAALAGDPAPLKQAKLIIEHNATDLDTGFQAFVDSEGWDQLELVGPNGVVLRFEGKGELGELGLTELFFETVEPENREVPIDDLLEDLPAGEYTFRARGMINGEGSGEAVGKAWLTHDIPAGPELLAPPNGATVPVGELLMRWGAVTKSIQGTPVEIIGYQLIVEKKVDPHPRMIGKWGLSMYLPASTSSMAVPNGFLEAGTTYEWEVLAIEKSGNQTLSVGEFRTR